MARQQLLKAYRNQVKAYLKRKYSLPDDKADAISMDICKKFYKPLTAIVEETKIDGKPEIKAVDLASWFDAQSENLISASGSVYMQPTKKMSKTIQMIVDMKNDRKKEKKLQFKAKAAGDESEALKHYYAQTLIKITMNSLPGNYGSPYSVFYSKANYNAITSCGRALIGYANAGIESVLGGNFAWFTKEELMQHIVAHLARGIDGAKVRKTMEAHKMRWVDGTELFEFYKTTVSRYKRYDDFFDIADIISKMTHEEIQYFYYFRNLRHILMGNDKVFRPWLNNMFDYSQIVIDPEVKPDDLFNLDGDLVTMCNVAFHELVDPGDSEIQVYDLPKKRPDLAIKFVCITRRVEKIIHEMDDIFETFIYTPINMTSVKTRAMMKRNSTVISDTDSVIFTVKDWVEWYTGDVYDTSDKAYHICCSMIYWIQKATAHFLLIYSQAHGARGEFERVMAMKNEFLYPVMILADKKKHYAGIVKVQEGVILPKPEIDIKGVQFKGSDICKEATEFAKNLIEKDILNELYTHPISAHSLIQKIVAFEKKIIDETKAGEVNWLQPESIGTKSRYKDPMTSAWYYYYAWQCIFAEKYGDISVPSKVPLVPIARPTKEYFEWLDKQSPAVSRNFKKFIETNARIPSSIAINPTGGKIPPELIPLVKIKDIAHVNAGPCHLIAEQLGIAVGFDKEHVLFCEVYPNC